MDNTKSLELEMNNIETLFYVERKDKVFLTKNKPTIVTERVDVFALSDPCEAKIVQPAGTYIDRCVITKGTPPHLLQEICQTMVDKMVSELNYKEVKLLTFRPPGNENRYLRELETPHKLELRLYVTYYTGEEIPGVIYR